MNKSIPRTLSALLLSVAPVYAAAQSACEVPGLLILEDASDDATVPLPMLDVLSLEVAQPVQDDGVARLVFTIKTGALTALPPQSAWFTSFASPGGTIRGVRMQTDTTGAASFISFVAAEASAETGGGYPGTLVDTSKPAEPESNFSADGTITIVVKAADVGIRNPGDELKEFNGGSILTIGAEGVASGSLNTDTMPEDLADRRGSFTTTGNQPCTGTSKSGVEQFGGAFGFGLLLPFFMMLGLRRRA